jgi:hypothetical protein
VRYLSPQTFLLLVAALSLLLGGGLWWASRLVGNGQFRTAQLARPARQQVTPVRRAPPSAPAAVPVAALSLAAMEVAAMEVAPTALPDEQPAGAKILRRDRGFSSASQPALRSGSHASLHVEARRPKPIA